MDKNKINIIAIIHYNQKNYCIYQKRRNIDYAIIDKEEFKFKLENKEKEILNKFYNLMRYHNSNSVFCGNYKIKHKEFEIYQDTRSNLYTFVLKKNNKRYIPAKEDIILLNTYFNDKKFVYYHQKQENNKKTKPLKFIKTILKEGGMFALAFISTTILTYNIPQNVKSNIDYEVGKNFRKDLTKEDKSYTFEDVKNAIDSNDNISEEEKEFIKEVFEAEFEENKEYMNLKMIIRKLETLKNRYDKRYTYHEETEEYELTHEKLMASVTAYYNSLNNTITCVEDDYLGTRMEEKMEEPFGFQEVRKSTYYHELNHLLTQYGIDSILTQLAEELAALENKDIIRNQYENF